MRSEQPKVLHEVMGRPMLAHVLNAVRYLEPEPLVVVTGHGAEAVEAAAAGHGAVFARQDRRLGTGHAAAVAFEVLKDRPGIVVIVPGDAPLLSPQTLIDLLDAHRALSADLSVLTVTVEWPGSYGRVIRDSRGWLDRVVEARDATEAELAVTEVNSGVYAADGPKLFEALSELKPDNDQGEYYLTDAVAVFRSKGWSAAAVEGPDPLELQGVNDRRELALAQSVSRERINLSWLLAGVTMADPSTAHIEAAVKLARDVTLGQGVVLTGATTVGAGALIGPYACLHDVAVAPGAVVPPLTVLSGTAFPAGAR
jgi:bifunctional UDP-N-acetylglucosamine pyrophosphorylase/glucosamine-1-phosphate N-acetyltransferase